MKKNTTEDSRPQTTTKKRSNAKSKQTSALLTPLARKIAAPAAPKAKTVQLPSRSILFGTIQTHAVAYKKPLNTIQLAQIGRNAVASACVTRGFGCDGGGE